MSLATSTKKDQQSIEVSKKTSHFYVLNLKDFENLQNSLSKTIML
jgi:hypothetical protein